MIPFFRAAIHDGRMLGGALQQCRADTGTGNRLQKLATEKVSVLPYHLSLGRPIFRQFKQKLFARREKIVGLNKESSHRKVPDDCGCALFAEQRSKPERAAWRVTAVGRCACRRLQLSRHTHGDRPAIAMLEPKRVNEALRRGGTFYSWFAYSYVRREALSQRRCNEESMDFDKLARRYRGAVARGYEAARVDRKWAAEQEAAGAVLRRLPPKSKVLDVPVGTGRLIPILASCGLMITGVDASFDMLKEAEKSARKAGARAELQVGDIRDLPFPDASFELVSCLRFLNWIDIGGVRAVLPELSRVSSSKLLIGVRYLTPLSEIVPSPRALVWRVAQHMALPSKRLKRWGLVLHYKQEVEQALQELDLKVVERVLIERRWDSSDYVFYLLEKGKRVPLKTEGSVPLGDSPYKPR